MTHPYDQIDYKLILALRYPGRHASDAALLAHYTRGHTRRQHVMDALEEADRMAKAAEALRAEIASYELEAAQASEVA
jgi:hypothetical protein